MPDVWSLNATTGRFDLAAPGGTRTVWLSNKTYPASSAIKLQCTDIAHTVKAVILSSGLAVDCWEVGILDATDAVIRTVHKGTPTGAHAPPGDVLVTAAHGLAAGQPFVMEARYTAGGAIELRLNGSSSAVVTYTPPAGSPFLTHRRYGFVSDVDGAVVTRAEICSLKPDVADYAEVGFAVCDGYVWYNEDPEDDGNWIRIGSRVFNATGRVALLGYKGVLLGLDGANPRKIDVATFAVSTWVVPTEVAGCTLLEEHLDRVGAAGNRNFPFAAFFSHLADMDDWNFGAFPVDPGGAFSLPASDRPQIGAPIVAMKSATLGVILLGTNTNVYAISGDFATGLPDVYPVTESAACSGPDSMIRIDDRRIVMHSTQGLFLIEATAGGASAINFSRDTLRAFVEIPADRLMDYTICLARSTEQHITFLGMTRVDGSESVHIAYDEIEGGFTPGRAGFLPDTYADAGLNPSAMCRWRGRVLRGTMDGRLVWEDPDAASDLGASIDFRADCALMDTPRLDVDTVLDSLRVLTDEDSGAITVKVYGGRSPEKAYRHDASELRWADSAAPGGGLISRQARAPALVCELTHSTADERVSVERIDAMLSIAELTRSHRAVPAAPPPPATLEPPPSVPAEVASPGFPVSNNLVSPPVVRIHTRTFVRRSSASFSAPVRNVHTIPVGVTIAVP